VKTTIYQTKPWAETVDEVLSLFGKVNA